MHGGKKNNNVKGFSKQEGIPEKPQKKPRGEGRWKVMGIMGKLVALARMNLLLGVTD